MHKSILLAALLTVVGCSSANAQGFSDFGAPATDTNATQGTANSGEQGGINPQSSDVVVTENNDQKYFMVQNAEPNPNIHTSKTLPMVWRGMTDRVPDGTAKHGMLAPGSVVLTDFAFTWDCGFGGPYGQSAAGSRYGYLPPVGTGTTNVDTIPQMGY